MKLILQVVENATLNCFEDSTPPQIIKTANIPKGLLIYLGIWKSDESDTQRPHKIVSFCKKLTTLKLFPDHSGKIWATILEHNWEILLISNFSLYGHYKSGNKIDFSQSGNYQFSKQVYEYFIEALQNQNFKVQNGIFWTEMTITATNLGPLNYIFEL